MPRPLLRPRNAAPTPARPTGRGWSAALRAAVGRPGSRYQLLRWAGGVALVGGAAHLAGPAGLAAAAAVVLLLLPAPGEAARRAALEAALRESEGRFDQLAGAVDDVVWLAEPGNSRVLYVSPSYERVWGRPVQSLYDAPRSFLDAVYPVDRPGLAAALAAQPGAVQDEVGYRVVRPDGSVRWVWDRRFPVRGPDGRLLRVAGVARDVTDRKAAEATVGRSERYYRTLFEHAHDPILVFDPDGERVLDCNQRACEVYGYPRAEFLRLSLLGISEASPDRSQEHVRNTLDGESSYRFQTTQRRRDGTPVHLDVSASAVEFDGRPAVLSINRDVTDRKRAEDALRRSEARFRAVFDQAALGIALVDRAGRVVAANPGFCRIVGRPPEAVPGLAVDALTHPDDRPLEAAQVRRVLAGEATAYTLEKRYLRPDGEARWVKLTSSLVRSAAGEPDLAVGVVEDVTDRRKLEDQYRQAQKMEAVGHLAGGVAHDFNNLLTVINGYAQAALDGLPPDDPAGPLLNEVLEAGGRAADLTRQLLAFSRQQVLQAKPVDLNELVTGVQKMLARVIGEDVRLATALHPAVGTVLVDPGQLEQVLLNLAVNARDAMPQGGRLTIETAPAELDASYAATHPEVRPGRYVLLAVTDTGTGMTPEVQARIFEPFFTTKEVGKGTGLGLATVFGIVKQSGGHLAVYSEVGRGTSFKVYLPEAKPAPAPAAARRPPAPTGHETVLLVEDEAKVRALAALALRRAGYTVVEAGGADEAVRAAAAHGRPVDLLLTDVVMPGGSGRALAERLTAADPGLRVLFTSGYTDDAVVRHGVLHAEVEFVQKPFTVDALLRKVREVLDKSASKLLRGTPAPVG